MTDLKRKEEKLQERKKGKEKKRGCEGKKEEINLL